MNNEFVTPNNKTIEVYQGPYGLQCRFKEGGPLPTELSGTWTNHSFAYVSIARYLAKKQAEVDKQNVDRLAEKKQAYIEKKERKQANAK